MDGWKKAIVALLVLVCVTVPLVSAAPTAAFSGTPTSGGFPLEVAFTNSSTGVTAPVSAYYWDFGDGNTATTENPSHTYNSPGTYDVKFKITDAAGSDWENKTAYISVYFIDWSEITGILGGVVIIFPSILDMVVAIFPIIIIVSVIGFVVAFLDKILAMVKW